jgi:hypothetical protein
MVSETLVRLAGSAPLDLYKLVSYMHGIMDGEAMMDYQVHKQTFTLV